MAIAPSSSLAELVIADARRSRIFNDLGLDYCCNGDDSLETAVSAAGLDLAEVQQALDLPPEPEASSSAPRDRAALAHDIVDTHHAYMWEEMPRLKELVDLVHRVHGDAHPELAEVAEAYHEAIEELDPHMTTEERVVFPAISRMERTGALGSRGSIAGEIEKLRDEHEAVGALLKRIRTATKNFEVPGNACASYQLMLTGLEEMGRDLHEHIHKENNILFPQVLELEAQIAEG